MPNILEREIQFLQGIGPKRAELLGKELGIYTFKDLLYTFPFRYVDRTKIYAISELEDSMAYIQVRGRITRMNIVGSGRGQRLTAIIKDETGTLELVFFQGIKWMADKLKINQEYIAFGKVSSFNSNLSIVHPEVDPAENNTMNYGSSMMGVYSSTENLRKNGIGIKVFTKFILSLTTQFLEYIKESLPDYFISENNLISLQEALKNIHFPSDMQILSQAQHRLKFEELFYLQLSLLKQKHIRTNNSVGIVIPKVGEYFNKCYANIPFELTGAQKRVIKEIFTDLKSGKQMNRLLQGDVGSGKTMVALLSALLAADNGYQSCIMAPTEVLATQHHKGALKLLEGVDIKIALLKGSTKVKERREIDQGLRDGSISILIGTHAVIEDKVEFKNLGFVVIDEQHRFGVEQRAKLRLKAEIAPHILVMTATPIPRTLAMTLYGDLDISVLDELPPGRKPIQTMHASENQRDKIFNFLKKEIKSGRQVFIVYPLIKESEKMDYKNLEEGYELITKEFPAPEYITAVVHGKQKAENKAYDMALFSEGKANILVATSVIEVGIDVPNASVMVIESAERFGLSQLHQLRGRVGRGGAKSYCILMSGYKLSKESRQRIELMCSTNDGFELAEADMRMRGAGNIEGTQQSGQAIELRIANLAKDSQILSLARLKAEEVLETDPLLESPENSTFVNQLSTMRKKGNAEVLDYSKIS